MKTKLANKLRITLAGVLALILSPIHVHASPPQYSLTVLGSLGGSLSAGGGINASGQVAGVSYLTGDNSYHAVRWTGTTPTDLGTLGGTWSNAFSINASGQIAGESYLTGDNSVHAVRWTGTTPTDLGTLGGNVSQANAINDSGQVAGWSSTSTNMNAFHAVRWTGTTPTDLGTLGGTNSIGYGINAYGDVTGNSDITGDTTQHAFLYTGGVMYDLYSLLLPGSGVTNLDISNAGSINNSGQIAATGTINGQQRALRLDPITVPEPTSIMLLLSGASLLGLSRRRLQ